MKYSQAIEDLLNGMPVCRQGWDEKGLFVFKQISAKIGPDVIPKMQSVPQKIKDIIMKRQCPLLNYENQMCIVHMDGQVNSWSPSVSDIFANDWQIYEEISLR
jgi:hypothetical protein